MLKSASSLSRIDIFLNTKSQHGVLMQFTQKLRRSLQKLGIRSLCYDVLSQPLTEIGARLAKDPPDCTIGFNVVLPEALFFGPLGIPHIALIVDSATYYPELLRCPNSCAGFAEMDSIDFLESLQKKHLFFFPHACEKSLASKKLLDAPCIYEALMPASFIDAEGPFSVLKEHFPKKAVAVFDDVVESCLASPDRSHLVVLRELFQSNEAIREHATSKGISFFDLFSLIELTMRGRDRVRLLQSLQGIEVTIACAQTDQMLWKKALGRKKNINYVDSIPYAQLFHAMCQSDFVINSIPTIKRGFHERLFLAASAGATTITNSSLFQQNYFPEDHAVIAYLAPHYKEINKKIALTRKNRKQRSVDIKFLKKKIVREHTWDVRAAYLVQQLPMLLSELPNNHDLNHQL